MKFKRLAAVILSAVTAFGAIGCTQTSSQSEPVVEENRENSSSENGDGTRTIIDQVGKMCIRDRMEAV